MKLKVKQQILKRVPFSVRILNPPVQYMGVELTNRCNLRCQMCYSRKREQGFMDFALFQKLVQELPDTIKCMGLYLGGESLLHPHFEEFVNYVKKQKPSLALEITTNGMLIHKHIDSLLKFDFICISLDGIGQVNDNIRVGSNFAQVNKNVNSLLLHKNDKTKIKVNMVVSHQTIADIQDYVNYWRGKVDATLISPAFSESGVFQRTKELIFEKSNRVFCTDPFGYLAVLWDGTITGCCHDLNGLNNLGNIREQALKQIWRGDKIRKLRYALVTNKLENYPKCLHCELWKYKLHIQQFQALPVRPS